MDRGPKARSARGGVVALGVDGMLSAVLRRRRAGAWALLWVILALAVGGVLGEAERSPSVTDALPVGADSTQVVELLERFPQGEDSVALALFTSRDGTLGDAALAQLRSLVPAGPPGLVVSEDGTAAVATVAVTGVGATEIADQVGDLRDRLRAGVPDGVEAQVTGPAAIQADLAAVFDGANFRLLGATALVVAVLLIATYRSPVLWLIPFFVVGVADRAAAALATHVLAGVGVAWDESTVGILSVLVFGAGTDYALLLISRYRDELREQDDRYVAMRHAVRRTAEAVLASSTTVFVGLSTLLLSVVPTTRGLGLACAVGVLVAAFAAMVVLPAALVVFGRWAFWPRVPRVGQATLVEGHSLWSRIGGLVAARPRTLVSAVLLVLLGLGLGLGQVRSGLSEADQFLEKPEAIAAAERLAESFPAGSADPTVVVTAADAGAVTAAVAAVDGVDSVRPGGTAEGLTRIDAVLAAGPGSDEAKETVRRLRAELAPFDRTWVGGTEAKEVDAASAADRDRRLLIPLILVLVLLALGGLLRSVVAPVVLVASVVATYLASLGASWWLFTGVFGFERLDVGVPLLAFLFLVALGVDYNIFLVTRAVQESSAHGVRPGILRALSATGGVITSAGILLAAVFAVLGVLPLVVLAQLGIVICVGVLLDTLVVRTLLVPAVVVILGDRFWWPRRVSGS